MSAIYTRELLSYFTSPIGYVFSAIFFAISGVCFTTSTVGMGTSDSSEYFLLILFFFVILIPLLTMKLFSEEKKLGTEQLLLTSPVSLLGIVFAKFLAAFTLFTGTFTVSALFNLMTLSEIASKQSEFDFIAKMNIPTFIGCFVGIVLIGGAFISIGLFISSLTENQIIAAIVSIGVFALMLASGVFAAGMDNEFLRVIIKWFSVLDRFYNFQRGVFDFVAVIYYVSIIAIFLFLTVRVYEKRRWN